MSPILANRIRRFKILARWDGSENTIGRHFTSLSGFVLNYRSRDRKSRDNFSTLSTAGTDSFLEWERTRK